jgi:hypothetical protein
MRLISSVSRAQDDSTATTVPTSCRPGAAAARFSATLEDERISCR